MSLYLMLEDYIVLSISFW